MITLLKDELLADIVAAIRIDSEKKPRIDVASVIRSRIEARRASSNINRTKAFSSRNILVAYPVEYEPVVAKPAIQSK